MLEHFSAVTRPLLQFHNPILYTLLPFPLIILISLFVEPLQHAHAICCVAAIVEPTAGGGLHGVLGGDGDGDHGEDVGGRIAASEHDVSTRAINIVTWKIDFTIFIFLPMGCDPAFFIDILFALSFLIWTRVGNPTFFIIEFNCIASFKNLSILFFELLVIFLK